MKATVIILALSFCIFYLGGELYKLPYYFQIGICILYAMTIFSCYQVDKYERSL